MPFKILYSITLAILLRAWIVAGVSMTLFSARGCYLPEGHGLSANFIYYRCTNLRPDECCSIARLGEPVDYNPDPSGQFLSCQAFSNMESRLGTLYYTQAYQYRESRPIPFCGRSQVHDRGSGCISTRPNWLLPFTGCRYKLSQEHPVPESPPESPGFMDMKGVTKFPLHFEPNYFSGIHHKRADESKCISADKIGMVINGTVYEVKTNSKEYQQFKATKDKDKQQTILITQGKKNSVQQKLVDKKMQKKSDDDKKSKDDKGKPSDNKGKSSDDKGKSKDDKDKPNDDKGKPSENKGKSSDDKRKSKDDKSKANDDKGKPSENKGKSKDDKSKRFRKLA